MVHFVDALLPHCTIRGTKSSQICQFSGIPYAEPPIGELRFAAPKPVRLQGTLDATLQAPIAPQKPSRLQDAMGACDARQDEDCLRLNIWTPAADDGCRPVVVWLHGGAWQSGGILPWYDGATLAVEGDIVVVAVGYRLGSLGWLPIPGATPNAGLLDQEQAIDWVIDNIKAFGGNPEAITLMGQSAGASSICAMLTRRPRFSRAILQSASLGRGWRSNAEGTEISAAYLEACGVRSVDEARALPVQTLLDAQDHPLVLQTLRLEGSGRSLFAPVRDGTVLPENLAQVLEEATERIDVLMSYTRDEMAAFPNGGVDPASTKIGDEIFGSPARTWAKKASMHGKASWLCRFDVAPTTRFGACHCIDLPFMFGNLDSFKSAPMLHGLDPARAQTLSKRVRRSWIQFIRHESPGWPEAPHEEVLS